MSTERRRSVFATTVVLVLLAATIAYGYFTATGSGSGTADVGNAASLSLSGTTTGTLYPGGAAGDVEITITNPNPDSQHVATVHLSGITADGTHSSCDVSIDGGNPAFTMADVSVNQTISSGGNTVVHGSLAMNDTGVDQNSCQGASLTLDLTSN